MDDNQSKKSIIILLILTIVVSGISTWSVIEEVSTPQLKEETIYPTGRTSYEPDAQKTNKTDTIG